MIASPLLQVDQVSRRFGGLMALNDVSFSVKQGEILALIGPNGAGKTTLFNIIAGAFPSSSGHISLEGRRIDAFSPERRCHAGVARTFQIPKPFLPMSVRDNIRVGAVFGGHVAKSAEAALVDNLMERLALTRWANEEASTLPLGARKKLEMARALATNPKVILLDEVMGGLTPGEVNEVIALIRAIRDDGVTIVFVEHVMRAVMALAERVVVLSQGELIAVGTPEQVTADEKVISAYLGGAVHGEA